jgi:adenylate cyclase
LVRAVPRRGYVLEASISGGIPDGAAASPTEPAPSAPEPAEALSPVRGPEGRMPSLAVLPFTNGSGSEAEEWLSDGIAEGIAAELSRSRTTVVIAPSSSFQYRKGDDAARAMRELRVRYILAGRVRRSGERVRVMAQLVEAATGVNIWGEHYDRHLGDVFALQDDIAQAVTLTIEPVIGQVEQQRAIRRPPEGLDAWEAYQRGLWHQGRFVSEDNAEARRCFERAIALDPAFASAYQALAHTYLDENRLFFTSGREQTLRAAEPLARKAVALDPDDAGGRVALGWVFLTSGDPESASHEAERAMELRPNSAAAYRLGGTAAVFSGRHAAGLRMLDGYFRLNPRDPRNWQAMHMVAMGRYLLRDYEAAIAASRHAIRVNPTQPLSYRWLAAALGQRDRSAEAISVLRSASVRVAPLLLDDYLTRQWPWQRPADHAHMLEGLCKAGWRGGQGDRI